MIKKILLVILALLAISVGVFWRQLEKKPKLKSPVGNKNSETESRVLDKYSFENLKTREPFLSEVVLGEEIESQTDFLSQNFSFESEAGKVSGMLTRPKKEGKFPAIIMIRGWIEPATYETGDGTWRVAEELAKSGFATLAPDFLGYGDSDNPPDNVWAERFLKPTTVMDLIASLDSLDFVENEKIGIWGHSNGGMISLAVLEISGQGYPTVLWAPVCKPFPYDILVYTDDYDDKGKALRRNLAMFEARYDVDKYSIDEYFDWIIGSLQIHQGTADEWIEKEWTDQLVEDLKNEEVEYEYYVYQGADHNLKPSWNKAVLRTVEFYKNSLN